MTLLNILIILVTIAFPTYEYAHRGLFCIRNSEWSFTAATLGYVFKTLLNIGIVVGCLMVRNTYDYDIWLWILPFFCTGTMILLSFAENQHEGWINDRNIFLQFDDLMKQKILEAYIGGRTWRIWHEFHSYARIGCYFLALGELIFNLLAGLAR